MNLYEIDKNIKDVIDRGYSFNEETGEILFETEDLKNLEMALTDKINNIVGYIKDLEIETKALEEVAQDYENRATSKKKKAERLKEYLDSYLKANNMYDKQEYKNGVVSYRSSKSLQIDNDVDLENFLKGNDEYSKYLKEKVTMSFDKKGITEELKNGNEIPFCQIIEKQNLQIK